MHFYPIMYFITFQRYWLPVVL